MVLWSLQYHYWSPWSSSFPMMPMITSSTPFTLYSFVLSSQTLWKCTLKYVLYYFLFSYFLRFSAILEVSKHKKKEL
jgi:hypothetical protein